MLFNSLVFIFLFLPITYCIFWILRTANARYVWLTITGYVFYGYWDVRFCLLMAFSTLVSYLAGLGFLKWDSPRARRLCLVIPITVDLLLLGFFKYVNFLLDVVADAAHLGGLVFASPRLDVVLPVGISFYTFHTITYIVDCYRGVVKPTRNFFEFTCYVSLFSQLVAGPIVRFRQIEDDLANLGRANRSRWLAIGISFFLFGLVEKVVVADTLAAFSDPLWADWRRLSTLGAWQASLAYTFQLYFDFSGYSTMAVGLGYLFGIRIPQNFNSPYKALDPSDFWRRWHISLSSCLRDYLYIPLGGNRGGSVAMYRNLLLTMLIGGLWHGANWTFVGWGLYHGVLLVLYRLLGPVWDRLPAILRQLVFFLLVLVGWVFFRAESMTAALAMLGTMFSSVDGAATARPEVFVPILTLAAWWGMVGPNVFDWHVRFEARPRLAWTGALVFGACLAIIMGGRNSPFLYFQF